MEDEPRHLGIYVDGACPTSVMGLALLRDRGAYLGALSFRCAHMCVAATDLLRRVVANPFLACVSQAAGCNDLGNLSGSLSWADAVAKRADVQACGDHITR